MGRPTTFAYILPLLVLALGACDQTLSPEEEHGGDDALAFTGGTDDLSAPDAEGWQGTPLLEDAEGFSRVGLRFDAAAVVDVEARFRAMGEDAFSEWLPATITYQDGVAHNALVDAPFVADAAEVRFLAPVEAGLSFAAVDLVNRIAGGSDDGESIDVESSGSIDQGLAADGIVVTRSQWGARARNCGGNHSPSRITIHHTVTPNNDGLTMAARVRQIQAYHIDVRGYCDVGYHFLVGQDGLIYQGRPEKTIGAHARGANTNNVGISFIGDFTSTEPSQAQFQAAARILRAVSDEYGISRNRTQVKGHRQVGTTATSCPGQRVYNRLEELVSLAGNIDGTSLPTGGSSGVTSDPSAPGCFSSTLNSSVDDGACVQVNYAGCGQGTCAWYTCDAGSWQCVNRESCQETASYPNAACGSVSAPVLDSCHSATLGRDVDHGSCVQVAYPGCGLDECAWYRCHDGSFQCSDLAACEDDSSFANASCPTTSAGSGSAGVTASYVDVPTSHPAFAAAEALRTAGAMWGCSPGQFCPDQPLSRAEVAYLFEKLSPTTTSAPQDPLFDDVQMSDWFFTSVQELATRGITLGCGPRLFCPYDGVSRAAAAVFLTRAEGIASVSPASPTFLDVGSAHWAYENIEAAYQAGLVDACSATGPKFCPGDFLTRADAAVLFARVYLGVE